MLEVKLVKEPTVELFEDYNDLFCHLVRLENMKMLASNPDFPTMNWNFTLYSPDRVALLFEHVWTGGRGQGVFLLQRCTHVFGL